MISGWKQTTGLQAIACGKVTQTYTRGGYDLGIFPANYSRLFTGLTTTKGDVCPFIYIRIFQAA